MQNKDIIPINEQGKLHGWCEKYHPNGKLFWKGLYKNDKEFGKFVVCYEDGTLDYIETFINGNYFGYCEHHYEVIKIYYAR